MVIDDAAYDRIVPTYQSGDPLIVRHINLRGHDAPVADFGLDLQAGSKDRIQVGVEDDRRAAARPAPRESCDTDPSPPTYASARVRPAPNWPSARSRLGQVDRLLQIERCFR